MIQCGLPFLIRQIHVGLPFLSCRCLSSHAVLLQASSARTTYPRASSAVASLEYRYSPTWMTEADGARADRGHRDHKAMHWARYSLRFLLRDAMPVRVCKILDVDATIATNTSSLIWPSFPGDVVDLSSQGYAAEMEILSLLWRDVVATSLF